MTPSTPSKSWLDQAEALVTELESQSSVEIVVAVAASSGNYKDAQLWSALTATWLTLAAAILLPIDIPEPNLALPALMVIGFSIGYLAARYPRVKHFFVGAQRKRHQVEEAAQLTFYREHVSATVDRTGILVYLSTEERDLEFLPDYGIDRVLPQATWNNLRQAILADPQRWTENLLTEMKKLQPVLNEKLPRKSDDRDELPNRPRMVAS